MLVSTALAYRELRRQLALMRSVESCTSFLSLSPFRPCLTFLPPYSSCSPNFEFDRRMADCVPKKYW